MNKTILLIDDDSELRSSLKELLEHEGFNVIDTGKGSEGIELFIMHDIHAVLCDILMPDISGIEVLGRLKEIDPTMDIIMMSGGGVLVDSGDYFDVSMIAGAKDTLQKPFKISELISILNK